MDPKAAQNSRPLLGYQPANGMQSNWQKIMLPLSKAAWLAVIAAFAYLGREEGGFIQDLWQAAKTASPFAAMLAILLFFDERRERREAQRQCNERTIDFIQSNNVASSALEKMAITQHEAISKMRPLRLAKGR